MRSVPPPSARPALSFGGPLYKTHLDPRGAAAAADESILELPASEALRSPFRLSGKPCATGGR